MPKRGGSFFSNLFGSFFDFDGDGQETLDELFVGAQLMDDEDEENKEFDVDEEDCDLMEYY